MTDCPFCQLISNPDQLVLVGETENFYAWLEVQPRAKGHTMIVPKEHTESIMDLGPGKYQEAMSLVREIMEKAVEGLGADGVSVAMNVEEAGGQMLPHAYIIVFPRFSEEENAGTPTGAIFPHKEELQDQSKLSEIKNEMSSVQVDFEEEKIEPHPDSQKHSLAPEQTSDAGNSSSEKNETLEEEQESREKEVDLTKRGESIQWQ